jgi:EpsI family protein
MDRKNYKYLLVIVLTLVAAVLVAAANRTEPIKNARFFTFPMAIGDWKGRDIPMSAYVYKGIETPYLFLREYSSPRYPEPVSLAVVWFDDTNLAFHTPEACLGGVSDEVKETGFTPVTLGGRAHRIGRIVANIASSDQLALYFFDVDGTITTSQSGIRMNVLRKRLVFKRGSASFVRVMIPVGANRQKAEAELADFLQAVYTVLPDYTWTEKVLR